MFNKKTIRILCAALAIVAIGAAAILFTNSAQKNAVAEAPKEGEAAKNPTFVITMEDGGVMTGELYPEIAPQAVGNFIELASSGFYDGLIFHRVIPGFMIQGGDPQGTGMGGPGWRIKGEFKANGITNDLKHTKGVLSMARSQHMDSAGSQFFLMVADAPHLDGSYAAFGKVLEGLDVMDKIVSVQRNASDKPIENQVIKSITVDTQGVEYPFEKLN
jgi:Peptidyl-prolyl cis-trans isomerase (rotamase) - cyclophilin family